MINSTKTFTTEEKKFHKAFAFLRLIALLKVDNAPLKLALPILG